MDIKKLQRKTKSELIELVCSLTEMCKQGTSRTIKKIDELADSYEKQFVEQTDKYESMLAHANDEMFRMSEEKTLAEKRVLAKNKEISNLNDEIEDYKNVIDDLKHYILIGKEYGF